MTEEKKFIGSICVNCGHLNPKGSEECHKCGACRKEVRWPNWLTAEPPLVIFYNKYDVEVGRGYYP